ncbi:hypothetical protein ABZ342_24350 [Amycolatopsis sp. NPDC005961]|uniref:hypothetical protein n=1 Tax=Amycolatopsis sp. NPDC005961 TaxID=3156720 RepID=UPI0033CA7FC0
MVKRRAALVALVMVLLVLAAGGFAFLPWTANHFGYALPGDRGLPYRIHHAGRDYRSYTTCAGAGWCHDEPYCVPSARLGGEVALAQVDEVDTWFGAAHPVFVAGPAPDGAPMSVVVRAGPDCYVGYSMMGGP